MFTRRVLLAIALSIGISGSVQAATVSMTSHIAFEGSASAINNSNHSSGSSATHALLLAQTSPPNPAHVPLLITVSVMGNSWIDRTQLEDRDKYRAISFDGPDNQIMNFLTLAANDGNDVIPVKAICSLGTRDCEKLYGAIKKDPTTLYVATQTEPLGSLAPSSSKNNGLQSFDLCAVYQ